MSSTPPLLRAEIFRYFLKVGYLGGRPVAKRDRFRFFLFTREGLHSFEERVSTISSIVRTFFFFFFYIYTEIQRGIARSKQDERYDTRGIF